MYPGISNSRLGFHFVQPLGRDGTKHSLRRRRELRGRSSVARHPSSTVRSLGERRVFARQHRSSTRARIPWPRAARSAKLAESRRPHRGADFLHACAPSTRRRPSGACSIACRQSRSYFARLTRACRPAVVDADASKRSRRRAAGRSSCMVQRIAVSKQRCRGTDQRFHGRPVWFECRRRRIPGVDSSRIEPPSAGCRCRTCRGCARRA